MTVTAATSSAPESDLRTEIGDLRDEVQRLAAEMAEMRAQAAALEALAHEDALTGALNRRGFTRDLARAIAFRTRYGTAAGLLLADLDRFKEINDTHGHEAGDQALVHFADILRKNIRASDSLGRLGGDEFAVIIWQVDEATARQKAASLQAIVETSPVPAAESALTLGTSIGVTMIEPGDTLEDALARADRAMYAQKAERRAGRGNRA